MDEQDYKLLRLIIVCACILLGVALVLSVALEWSIANGIRNDISANDHAANGEVTVSDPAENCEPAMTTEPFSYWREKDPAFYYGNLDPQWVKHVDENVPYISTDESDSPEAHKLYWEHVSRRMQDEENFLLENEEEYLQHNIFSSITCEDGLIVGDWAGSNKLYYPIIFKNELCVCVVGVNETGSLIMVWRPNKDGDSFAYMEMKEQAHKSWDHDVIYCCPMYSIAFDQEKREITVWSMGEKYANYTVPDGLECVYVPQNSRGDHVAQQVLLFGNSDSNRQWAFWLHDSLHDYEKYHGGDWCYVPDHYIPN